MTSYNLKLTQKILLCCVVHDNPTKIAAELFNLLQQNPDWQELLLQAGKHKLIPQLHLALNQQIITQIPVEFIDKLNAMVLHNAKNNFIITVESIKIIELLQSAGITAILFKGPALAMLAHQDVTMRQFGDIDIFVAENNLTTACNILGQNGYNTTEEYNCDTQPQHKRHISFNKNHFKLELHWRIEHNEFRFDTAAQTQQLLYTDKTLIELHNHKILSFTIENLIILQALHCSNHRWDTLSSLYDIALLSTKYPQLDWQTIVSKTKQLHITKIVATTFYLINNLLGYPIATEMQELIQNIPGIPKFADYIQRKSLFASSSLSKATKLYLLINNKDSLYEGITGTVRFLIGHFK